MAINYGSNDVVTSGTIQTPQLKLAPSPGTQDYIDLYSYNRFINGGPEVYSGSAAYFDKFAAFGIINDSQMTTDAYFTLKLVQASVFGQTIKHSDLSAISSVTVDEINVSFRDDGNGMAPSNYVDYIDNLFDIFGLNSSMETYPDTCKINFCKLDKFYFVFEETGDGDGILNLSFPKYWVLKTIEPWGLLDAVPGFYSECFGVTGGVKWLVTPPS
jgi:hypothetical protein